MMPPRLHPNLLHIDNALLVIVDMQEPFLRNIPDAAAVIKNVMTLAQGAHTLRMPVLATTQYREKMGDVIPEIKKFLPPFLPPFEKMTFSACSNPAFASEVQRSGRKQILLCGVETHICISQTAHDLVGTGFQVHLIADAVSSRTERNRQIGIDRMRQGGTLLSSVETALYELLQEAGSPEFREILSLIK